LISRSFEAKPMTHAAADSTQNVPPYITRFEQMAYGLFMHYGLYSLLGRGEWVMSQESIPAEEYAQLAERFTAERFSGRALAKLAAESGMRYAVLTARHHEGFSLYDTRGLSDFDAPHSPAGRDLIEDFVTGCRAEGIVPFLYHTTLDWKHHTIDCDEQAFDQYLDYLIASVEILCKHYGPIGGFWFDGNWSREGADWREDELYGMIRRLQPDAIIVNNSGLHQLGAKTHPQLDAVTFERGTPHRASIAPGQRYVASEMCQTTNQHWGYAADDFQHRGPAEIIRDLCACRRAKANLLLNVGPAPDGSIPDLDRAVLRRVGQWVARHDDLLRHGLPTDIRCEGGDFVLEHDGRLFYFAHDLSCGGDVNVALGGQNNLTRRVAGLDRPITAARWLDGGPSLEVSPADDGEAIRLALTGFPYGRHLVVRVAELLADA
jgi:alpha-L-fucosidase